MPRRLKSSDRKSFLTLCLLCLSLIAAGPAPSATDHWSFKALSNPTRPSVHDSSWPLNPIDAFILAKLESETLHPSPPADRRTLCRRVYFDLIGLPPTPEELERFVSDPAPDAYERLVDRLLASPRYGERWARHWLDVMRFAESNGFEMNQPRRSAWRYRDYVIRSFNEDLPYDQFVRQQLAGDATGHDEATGYLVAGAWDQVKSPDPGLTAQQRMDELHDMVATTGATFLGLTVGCARCHDHKFDPVTQVDYYRMQAIFAGVQHGERRVGGKQYERELARLMASRRAVEAKLIRFEPKADPAATQPSRPAVNPRQNVERFDAVEARFVRLTILATDGAEPCIDEIEVLSADEHVNLAMASVGAKVKASSLLPGFAIHQVSHLIDGK